LICFNLHQNKKKELQKRLQRNAIYWKTAFDYLGELYENLQKEKSTVVYSQTKVENMQKMQEIIKNTPGGVTFGELAKELGLSITTIRNYMYELDNCYVKNGYILPRE